MLCDTVHNPQFVGLSKSLIKPLIGNKLEPAESYELTFDGLNAFHQSPHSRLLSLTRKITGLEYDSEKYICNDLLVGAVKTSINPYGYTFVGKFFSTYAPLLKWYMPGVSRLFKSSVISSAGLGLNHDDIESLLAESYCAEIVKSLLLFS